MHGLLDGACGLLWDRIVCISDWQRAMYHRCLRVPEERLDVLRNAISPAFERMFRDASELGEAKSRAVRLAYTSTPFRGLDLLVSCFPEIRRRHSDCRLDVFSSMYPWDRARDQDYRSLYEQCRATEGINYRGAVSQTQLAEELRGVRILAYPNTFAETSCIAVMEALAAGALVVTSDLGALPETCAGWAKLVPRMNSRHPRDAFNRDFAEAVTAALDEMQADWPAAAAERYRQVEAINAACTWSVRATQWEGAAARWLLKGEG
jgi:glycosyltransferase involved in cell wall biosynthesis